MKKAYTTLSVIIITTFLVTILSSLTLFISFSYRRNSKKIKEISQIKEFYKVLEQIKLDFEKDIDEDTVSPYSGWFKDLILEKDNFTISYFPEDSKIDINHFDKKKLLKIGLFKSDIKLDQYIYSYNYIEEVINNKEMREIFSIYMMPNLNITDLDSLRIFMESQRIKPSVTDNIIRNISSYRNNYDYLTYSGLIINKDKYEYLRSYFDREELDRFYEMFDYEGSINLNFVTKDVFRLGISLCLNDMSNDSYNSYWNILSNKRDRNETVKDIKEIFGEKASLYKKMFGVNSRLFNIRITGDNMYLESVLRRYMNFRDETKCKIFRTSIIKKENQKKMDLQE